MKVIVIGAGASYAEAKHAGAPDDLLPPLMGNFARKTWREFNPHPYLDRFLESLGYVIQNEDGRKIFNKLEKKGVANVEQFFEFCWLNREKSWSWSNNSNVQKPGMVMDMKPANKSIARNTSLPLDFMKGVRIIYNSKTSVTVTPDNSLDYWDNLLTNGVAQPLVTSLIQWMNVNGQGFISLDVSKSIIPYLKNGDLIINLNYDTIFEIALEQERKPFRYSPNYDLDCINIAKPHGSINMVVFPEKNGFQFSSDPKWMGQPEHPEGYSYIGMVPPRSNKRYEQHPVARTIIQSLEKLKATEMIFWGVGLTESDVDLLSLYRNFSTNIKNIDVINPDISVHKKIRKLLGTSTRSYTSLTSWTEKQKNNRGY